MRSSPNEGLWKYGRRFKQNEHCLWWRSKHCVYRRDSSQTPESDDNINVKDLTRDNREDMMNMRYRESNKALQIPCLYCGHVYSAGKKTIKWIKDAYPRTCIKLLWWDQVHIYRLGIGRVSCSMECECWWNSFLKCNVIEQRISQSFIWERGGYMNGNRVCLFTTRLSDLRTKDKFVNTVCVLW